MRWLFRWEIFVNWSTDKTQYFWRMQFLFFFFWFSFWVVNFVRWWIQMIGINAQLCVSYLFVTSFFDRWFWIERDFCNFLGINQNAMRCARLAIFKDSGVSEVRMHIQKNWMVFVCIQRIGFKAIHRYIFGIKNWIISDFHSAAHTFSTI